MIKKKKIKKLFSNRKIYINIYINQTNNKYVNQAFASSMGRGAILYITSLNVRSRY